MAGRKALTHEERAASGAGVFRGKLQKLAHLPHRGGRRRRTASTCASHDGFEAAPIGRAPRCTAPLICQENHHAARGSAW